MKQSFYRNLILILFPILLLLSLHQSALAADIKLAWDPNTESDLAGYKVHYGTSSGTYGTPINVGNVTTYTLTGLTQGQTYFIAVTAYDTSNQESGFSNEVNGTANDSESVSTPNVLSGPTSGTTGISYSYTTGGSTSSLGDSVQYQFDWKGDGTDLSAWGSATQSKTWSAAGTYNVRSRARCATHTTVVSNWSSSLTVTINPAPQSFTVATNPSGRQITVDSVNYTAPQTFSWTPGSSHTLSVASPQSGSTGTRYVYSSWSDGGAQTHTITAPSSGTTYTANFTTQYSLTTSASPSAGGTVSPSGTNWYNSGQSVSISATVNAGYTFSNWSGDLSGSTNPTSITMNAPKNGVANFSQIQYTLTININPSGSGSVSKSPDKSTYVYGEQVTLTATANSGYTFGNWSGDATGANNPTNLTINGNKTVTANFSAAPETISTPTVPSGPMTGITGTSYTYTTGGATSNLGHSVQYQFDWKGDGSDLSAWGAATQSKTWSAAGTYNVRSRARCSTHTTVVSSWSTSLTVTISAAPQSYTVTTNPSNPSGHQITVDDVNYTAPQTFTWVPGSTHKLSVSSPQDGTSGTRYVYSSWSDGGAQTHNITVPSSGTTYTANFTTQYSSTTSASPSTGGTVNPSGTNWYNSGQSVSISATANAGYTFSNWSGDLSGSTNPTSISMNGPKNVVANFETISIPTAPSGPTTANTNSSNAYSAGGSSSNLGHTVEYQFDWKGDGTDLSAWGAATQSKTWTVAGTYNVRSRARCATHTSAVSSWSGYISVTISTPPISNTVTTNPSGLQITVDGTDYTSPQTFSWTAGSSHTVHASSPQARNPGTQYVYQSWNDGGAQTHTITASSSSTNHTASFKKQSKLKASASPSDGGAVTVNGTVISSSDSNYYDSDQNVPILAIASSGYGFTGWQGDLSGTTNPVYINMNEPRSVIANFTPIPGATTLVSPSGTIFISAPTYTWNAVAASTWYCLWVNDSTGAKIQQWYTAADVGCASGTGTCSVTSATTLAAGAYQWKVQTYSSGGYGPWSSPMSFTVSLPGAATLASPSGEITDTTPTYAWNAGSGATWYRLWVNDSTGNKIQTWYNAAEAGCPDGTGICSITPTTEVLGSCQWWVQTWNSVGYGSWSAPLSFTTPIPAPPTAATQISPSGEIADTTPTYTWNAVSDATWYCLYVNDSSGNKINQWYPASDAGCPDSRGTCSVTPSVALAPGAGQWYIRTYNSAGYGPWSLPGKNFVILTQSLYDDFSGTSINKDKWGQGELVREIQGGKLVSKATAFGSRVINNLDFRNPASIAYLEADVMIEKIEGDYDPNDTAKYSLPNARIAGFFYNDGTASGAGSHKGEVQGVIRMVLHRGKLSAQWAVEKSLDDEANQWETLGSGVFPETISLNLAYKLSIQFEPSLKRFTFKLGTSVLTWTSTDTINPSNTPWKAIGTDVDFFPTTPSPHYGKVSATFDNVLAKDGSGTVLVSDDFSSSPLDPTKWATYELVREILGGKLRSKVRSSSATTSSVYNSLEFPYPSAIDMVQVKVTPVAYQNSQGAQLVARIAGDYYNDGTGTRAPGDHTGDVTAQVWIGGTGINPVVSWMVSRSTDSAGEVPATVASGTFATPITLGNTYTLSMWWDGSRFIFTIDNEEATYTPTTSINPPRVPTRAIGTRISAPAGKEATIEALFDDVVVYYTQPSGATLVSPSGTIKDTTPTYTWNAAPEATWYRLWVNDSTGNKIQQWYTASALGCASGVGSCSVTPSTEVIGSCQWWVQTYNPAGFGPWSAPLSFTIPPPAAATLISPSGAITDTTPTYTWNAVSDATWYQLYVNDSTGNKIQQWFTATAVGCASGTGTCSVTPTIEVIGACQWWVRTYNPSGFGPWSSPLLFTTPIPTIPVAATLISPSGTITDTTPTYTWNAVSDATWYQLYVNDSTGNKIQQWYAAADAGCASGTGTCSVTPTTTVFGSSQWWVQTYNAAGFGPWSASMSFTTPIPPPPPAATLISPSGTIDNFTPTYKWNAVSTATDYLLWVNDSTGNRIQQWYTASQANCSSATGLCSVTPTTILSSGSCQWWVQTSNSGRTGPWSSALSFTTPAWIK